MSVSENDLEEVFDFLEKQLCLGPLSYNQKNILGHGVYDAIKLFEKSKTELSLKEKEKLILNTRDAASKLFYYLSVLVDESQVGRLLFSSKSNLSKTKLIIIQKEIIELKDWCDEILSNSDYSRLSIDDMFASLDENEDVTEVKAKRNKYKLQHKRVESKNKSFRDTQGFTQIILQLDLTWKNAELANAVLPPNRITFRNQNISLGDCKGCFEYFVYVVHCLTGDQINNSEYGRKVRDVLRVIMQD